MKDRQSTQTNQLNKIKAFRPFAIVAVLVVLCTAIFLYCYNHYTEKLLYEERLNQMTEVTAELFSGLESVAKSEWVNTEMQCKFLEDRAPESVDDLIAYMEKQAELSDFGQTQTSLLVVDSDGLYYTETGRKGLLSEQRYLLSDPERVSFVSNSMFGNKAEMVFLMRLSQPLTMTNGTKTVTITYCGIAQNMAELEPYFTCNAYENNNGMYVLDEHGLKIFSGSPNNKIRGFNVFSVLRQMEYTHGSSFASTKEQVDETGLAYSNAIFDGEEYYYALYRMDNAEWMLLLTVPSRYVATNTVTLMNSATQIILAFAFVMVIGCAVLIFRMLSKQKKSELSLERRSRHALEEANRELEAAVQKAEQAEQAAISASRAKSEFLSNMSHDIRTPMNAIVGITKLIEHERDDPQKLDEYIHKVQTSSQHLLSLINDVLDMSKIETGDVTLNREQISLADQISQVESIVRPQIEERGQHFTVHTRNITHEHLIGDAVRLRQVLINLLSNAVKYTPNGGTIAFELEELPCELLDHARIRIAVKDSGCGMTQEFVEHIFEPFTRAENSMTNKVQGTGLGMAITKKIVDLAGGTISVQSEVNKGSCFTVELPILIDQDAKTVLPVQTVLLITDDHTFVENAQAAFRETDVTLLVAMSEAEADALLKQNTVEVALLGSSLNGDTLAGNVQKLRKNAGNALLLYCCDYDEREQLTAISENGGVDGVLARPFFLSNLAAAIALVRSSAPEEAEESVSVLNGKRFLCAEDNALNAEILQAVLDMNGASCVICPDGQKIVDAFASVKPGEFDAILMDVQMPVMNGLDATRAIRHSVNPLGKTIPIIAMTANAFSEDVQNCLSAGMDAHVSKPLDIGTLERTLKSVAGGKFSGGGQLFTHRRQNNIM